MAKEAEALHAAEVAADAAAWQRAARFKVVLVTGDLVKNLTGRSKFHGAFDVASVGHRHVHLAGKEYQLSKVSRKAVGYLVGVQCWRHAMGSLACSVHRRNVCIMLYFRPTVFNGRSVDALLTCQVVKGAVVYALIIQTCTVYCM